MTFAKTIDSLVETIYTSATLFVYYYIFTSLVDIQHWTVGFHPLTDLKHLAIVFLLIAGGTLICKCVMSLVLVEDEKTDQKLNTTNGYVPSNRKCI